MALSVGILTMHRVRNCGSFLQAFALQSAIEKMGYKSEIIDYIYPNPYHYIRQGSQPEYVEKSTLWDLFKSIVKKRFDAPIMIEVRIFKWLVKHKLHLSKSFYTSPDDFAKSKLPYDILCVGSDQVWNPRFSCCDESFLLSFVDKKKISYASSVGTSQLSKEELTFYKNNLTSFSSISVRELCNASLLSNVLGRTVYTTLDPIFLLSQKEWCSKLHIHTKRHKHILYCVYNYMDNVVDEAQKILKRYISDEDVVVALTPLQISRPHKCYSLVTPRLFVKSIAESSMIITDSFHVTAFAILFNIPFIPILGSNIKDVRVAEMLRMLNITPPPSASRTSAKDLIISPTNETKLRLQQWIIQSKEYLKNAIES